MPIVCGVTFRGNNKIYHFGVGSDLDLAVDDHVIVDTSRGDEMGRVAQAPREMERREVVGDLKPVLRLATTAELIEAERYRLLEDEAVAICRERVRAADLPMKMVAAEYSYDGSRLTFTFSSEERVDFRNLVRELAREFKTRIELRQVGVRDEARVVGGIGKCGRPLCCATWLDAFAPVSIRMAKQQNLPLSPNEISGLCGRLLCCLNYEYDYYKEVAGRFPRVGKIVESPVGLAKVLHVSVLRETVDLLLEDGSRVELTAEQFNGEAPIAPPDLEHHKAEQLVESLERLGAEKRNGPSGDAPRVAALPQPAAEAAAEPRPRRRGPHPAPNQNPRPVGNGAEAEGQAPQQRSSGRRRRPRRRNPDA
jgi:cell fate regulator YaaT (PSP1 superfamily)